MATTPTDSVQSRPATGATKIKWDYTGMRSSYANVCNVSSTREEVVLLFGLNQAAQASEKGQVEVTVQASDRIILSPYAAKRLALLLDGLVREYEARFGPLNLEGVRAAGPAAPQAPAA